MKAEQLRKSILQMAIQGKLVPQDPNDEPASVLLEKIRAEKQKLIKEGKIKKDKFDSVIFKGDDNRHYEKVGTEVKDITDEIPFEIPESWEWCRIKNIALTIFSGKSPVYSKVPTSNKVIGQQSNQKSGIDLSYIKYCTDEFARLMPQEYYLRDGDVLLNTLGNGTLGRCSYFNSKCCADKILTDGHLFVFRTISLTVAKFIYVYLRAMNNEIVKSANGTTNQTFLNLTKTQQWLFPVPSIMEQARILERIASLQPLIAEYDKLEKEATVLDNTIKDKLKKSILQYAIQGKLVPQDENDEPASVLLERIRAEKKAKLGKKYADSYIYKGDDNCYYEKVGNQEPVCIEDELPFDVPKSWFWEHLGNLISIINGVSYDKKDVCNSGIRILRGGNINNLQVTTFTDDIFLPTSYRDSEKQVRVDDIVIVASTGSKAVIGKAGYIEKVFDNTQIGAFLRIIRPLWKEFSPYTRLIFATDYYRKHIRNQAQGTNINNVKAEYITKLIIPIPPIEEQKRIVKQIDSMFSKIKDVN